MSKRKKLERVRDALFPEGRLIDLPRSVLRVLEPPTVPLDVFERDGSVVVKAELAGVDPENVDVVVVNGELRISGEREEEESIGEDQRFHSERSHGRIYRSVDLPEGADVDGIRATMKNGVLEVVVPTDRSSATRKIPITRGE